MAEWGPMEITETVILASALHAKSLRQWQQQQQREQKQQQHHSSNLLTRNLSSAI